MIAVGLWVAVYVGVASVTALIFAAVILVFDFYIDTAAVQSVLLGIMWPLSIPAALLVAVFVLMVTAMRRVLVRVLVRLEKNH